MSRPFASARSRSRREDVARARAAAPAPTITMPAIVSLTAISQGVREGDFPLTGGVPMR